MTPTDTTAVIHEVHIAAEPETVFPFFIDPDKMIQWKGREAELDPRPGGVYRVDVTGEHVARGEYVELDPPHRVVFTWGWEGADAVVPPGSSTVEITLTAQDGGTLVRLEHRDLPEGERAPHGHGWDHYLERLAVAAAGGDAGPDPWAEEGADRS
jgi:uncharacterized protein YndB with AHSA1/START domain